MLHPNADSTILFNVADIFLSKFLCSNIFNLAILSRSTSHSQHMELWNYKFIYLIFGTISLGFRAICKIRLAPFFTFLFWGQAVPPWECRERNIIRQDKVSAILLTIQFFVKQNKTYLK